MVAARNPTNNVDNSPIVRMQLLKAQDETPQIVIVARDMNVPSHEEEL